MDRVVQRLQPPGRASDQVAQGFGLWNLAFRPFYLLGSLFAATSVALWTLQYAGLLPFVYVQAPTLHGSEMLFGYATAIIAGFLLTAVRNWTGQPTLSGASLASLAMLWLAGRLLVAWPAAAAVATSAFLVALAGAIALPLWRTRNRRNLVFVGLLLVLAFLAQVPSLADARVVAWPARVGLQAGLDIVMFIMAVISGRVIPMFTANAVPGADPRRAAWVERASLGGIAVLLVADAAGAPALVIGPLAAALAVLHGARLWLWHPWRTRRVPLVWILHAAYGWMVVHLALRALSALDVVPSVLALHALTIGAIGGLTIGMMTRTARGHTGRPLRADRVDVTCYALVMAAAIIRVPGALLLPDAYVATVLAAAACWTLAFALYAIAYAPSLLGPRADGKPG
jgi:uncharacterized protein involved in response to NO